MTTLVDGGAIPVGAIIPFGGNSNNIPDGFLICNGAALNRNTFAALFEAIGTHWGTTTGTNFRVPTTQGLILRGVSYGSGFDPDRNSRTAVQSGGQTGDQVGSFQNDRYRSHLHATRFSSGGGWGPSFDSNSFSYVNGFSKWLTGNGALNSYAHRGLISGASGGSNPTPAMHGFNGNLNNNRTVGKSIYTSYSGSNQTVGINVYVNYIIKY